MSKWWPWGGNDSKTTETSSPSTEAPSTTPAPWLRGWKLKAVVWGVIVFAVLLAVGIGCTCCWYTPHKSAKVKKGTPAHGNNLGKIK